MGWSKNFQVTEQKLKSSPDKLLSCLEKVMQQTLETGKTRMVDEVNRADTPFGLSQGRSGRVKTGDMRGSIDTLQTRTKDSVEGAVGWLEDDPFYTKFQELGFTHYLTGAFVEGVHALANTREDLWEDFVAGCEDCLKEVANV